MKDFFIADFEWTSWRGNYYGSNLQFEKRQKWQKREIIQIGLLKVNLKFKIIGEHKIYIKPSINPILSNYIKELTNISQNIIEINGINFKNAYDQLAEITNNSLIISNGIDGKILEENYKINGLKCRKVKIHNIKEILYKKYDIPKKMLHSTIIHAHFGYKIFKKHAHDGLKDCKNILKVLKKINFDFKYVI